ncbi:MAG: hypothetical protein MR274_09865 [Clostridium sp.]|nr:hypothetical protein [Clostridium sp.]
MFKYEFKNENDEELCTLETTVDISEIIQEYRGEYIGSSKGYKNPKGCSDSDGYIYWDYFQPCFCVIKTKENGETEYVYPSLRYKDRKYYSGKSVNDCSRVDIRRIIGDVLYCLYIEKIFIGEVNCIKINNEEYKGIKNVSFVGENDQRIIFYDESDKKILIPISLDSKESKLYPFSKKGLFVLKDKNKNINLNIWEQRIVNSKNFKSYDKPYRDFYVDLFYGSYNEEVGIFFYFENEIKSLYTINKRSEITVCDLKCTFFISRYIKYSFDKDENIKYDDYKNLQNSDDIREKFIKLINEKFKKYVYSQKKIDNYSIIKSNNSNSYKVQFEFCNYIFDLTEVNVINTDLCIECQDLGRIEKGNVSIYLDSNLNNWIFEIMGYKVKKDILEKNR